MKNVSMLGSGLRNSKGRTSGRSGIPGSNHTPRLRGLLVSTIAVFALFTFLALLTLLGVAWILNLPLGFPSQRGKINSQQLYDVVRTTVSAGALVGGIFAIVYAYRKQRIEEGASIRNDAELLNKRYQDAADQLGHGQAAVRIAGVYAIARLADDWFDNRQMCVDVLCGYLRLPYIPGSESLDEAQVRLTIQSAMRKRLSDPSGSESWCDLLFDFTDATFDAVQLGGCVFRKWVSFSGAKFVPGAIGMGTVNLADCRFEGGVSFFQTSFSNCVVRFDKSVFSGKEAFFGGADFSSCNVFFRECVFGAERVYFGGNVLMTNVLENKLESFIFNKSKFQRGIVVFNGLDVHDGMELEFLEIELSEGNLDLSNFLDLEDDVDPDFSLRITATESSGGLLKLPVDVPNWWELEVRQTNSF